MQNAYYLLLLLSLCSGFRAEAQNKQKYFRQECGLAFSTTYDDSHSLAQYAGTGFQLRIGDEIDRRKSYSQFDNALMIIPCNTVGVDTKYASSLSQLNLRIGNTYLRKLPKTPVPNLNLAVGGAIAFDANSRTYPVLDNNVRGWDLNFGLNLVGRGKYDFNLKNHSFSVSYQLGLPALTYNHRPNYLGDSPIGEAFKGKDEEGADWASLGRLVVGINGNYVYINQQINLDKITANGNRIRLGYNWNYANNSFDTYRYQNLLSGLSFGVLTNFSKKSDSLK